MSYPQRTLKDGLLYLGGRSDEDDGYLTGKMSVQSVVDTTTDPTKHFIGRRMQNDILNSNRHKNFIIERHAGTRYCWIRLRTPEYAALVRSRIPLRDSVKMVFSLMTLNVDSPTFREPVLKAISSRKPTDDCNDIVDTAQEEIGRLFSSILSDHQSYPVLLTGAFSMKYQCLLSVLILLAAKTPVHEIQTLVFSCLHSPVDEISADPENTSVLKDLIDSKHTFVQGIHQHMNVQHGGIETYLREAGVSPSRMQDFLGAMQIANEKPGND
ncbi:hypothetical protein D0869_13565 [Hortaea werneckii]|uniref:Uncharacterized protein n=1 Tax=Hortaea werneckii TaxID=91943 RepID=A0A3M6W4T6_HORWE|nr:hypothetical protein KC334_g14879 [Hortaea werneckii]KAI6972983.1 hypothetical protein KC355_g11613 [Hortaea werneckii]KAI7166134.1 hypothetical protein KC324_g12197 [Hortaea werneckii]KAI7568250.1 hypothetical protein KC316_g12341 [Hortaea werneckii]KAI7672279.1 hypothetical protein KC318_g2958 [Hortaea werneckii]